MTLRSIDPRWNVAAPARAISSVLVVIALRAATPELSAQEAARTAVPIPGGVGALRVYLSAADVDGDGDDDLIAAYQVDEGGVIWTSDGAGGFSRGSSFRLGFGAGRLAAGDVDGDGRVDLCTRDANSSSAGTASLAFGAPDGRFVGQSVALGLRPHSFGAGDFDGDGRTDLAFASDRTNPRSSPAIADCELQVGFGARGRSLEFEAPRTLPLDHVGAAVAVDFDGDGRDELAVWGRSVDRANLVVVEWQPGRAPETFLVDAPLLYALEEESGIGPELGMDARDVDRDGREELYLHVQIGSTRETASRAIVVERLADGAFASHSLLLATTTSWLVAGDFDGDGAVDLAGVGGTFDLTLWRGRPDARFALGDSCIVDLGCDGSSPTVGDFDGDGVDDLAVECEESDEAHVFVDPFSLCEPRALAERHRLDVPGATLVRTATFAEDGDAGFFVVTPDAIHAYVFEGAEPLLAFSAPAPLVASDAAVGDVDGDGLDDLALLDGAGGRLAIVGSPMLDLLAELDLGDAAACVVLEDVDGDGAMDLLVTLPFADSLLHASSDRDAESFFDAPLRIPIGRGPGPIAVLDIDGDRRRDVVVADASAALTILPGRMGGGFREPERLFAIRSPTSLLARDLDGDRREDLLVASHDPSGVLVFLGGDAFTGRFVSLPDGAEPDRLGVTDVDADGILDAVVATRGARAVGIITNAASRRPVRGQHWGFGDGARHPIDIAVVGRAIIAADPASGSVLVSGSPVGRLGVATGSFRRGDVDGDGGLSIGDAIAILGVAFRGAASPSCPDAADANDDGALDVSDAVAVLGRLFLGDGPLPRPGPLRCGEDPSPDGLGACTESGACEAAGREVAP